MSAIPEAVGARYAQRGVARVLLRAVVLGGLVIAGWLLGSGIALAQDGGGHSDPGHEQLVQQHTSVVQLIKDVPLDYAVSSEENAGAQPDTPSSIGSTVTGLRQADPVSPLRVQSPVQIPTLTPVLTPAAVTTSDTESGATQSEPAGPAHPGSPRAAIDQAAPVASALHEAARPVTTPATGLAPVRGATAAAPVSTAARPPVADRLAERSSVGDDPVAPVPASPPPATTSAAGCLIGGAGGGASDRVSTLGDMPGSPGLTPTRLGLCTGASGIPQSAAQRPSTSPD